MLLKKLKTWILHIVNNCLCSTFGHKWSKGRAKQYCKREGCGEHRVLMWRRHAIKIGEPALRWHYYNLNDFGKLP